MSRVVIDISFLFTWKSILSFLILVGLYGYITQTDKYIKINELPEQRSELDPIKNIQLDTKANSIYFNIDIDVITRGTLENLIDSINFRVKNEYFTQNITLRDSHKLEYNKKLLKGVIHLHFFGSFTVDLFYLETYLNRTLYLTNVTSNETNPYNSLISCENGCYFSNVCLSNGKFMLFSQQLISLSKNMTSIGTDHFGFISTVSYNFKDRMTKNKLVKNSKGIIYLTSSHDYYFVNHAIIRYIKEVHGDERVYLVSNSDETKDPSENIRLLRLKYDYCFSDLEFRKVNNTKLMEYHEYSTLYLDKYVHDDTYLSKHVDMIRDLFTIHNISIFSDIDSLNYSATKNIAIHFVNLHKLNLSLLNRSRVFILSTKNAPEGDIESYNSLIYRIIVNKRATDTNISILPFVSRINFRNCTNFFVKINEHNGSVAHRCTNNTVNLSYD